MKSQKEPALAPFVFWVKHWPYVCETNFGTSQIM